MTKVSLLPVLAAAACLTVGSAIACDPRSLPPAYFDHEPTVGYKVYEWDDEMLSSLCDGGQYRNLGGCAEQVSDDFWYIYIAAGLDVGRDCLLRHEKGHVNGWLHNDGWPMEGRPPR
jgi:hypothetical protein